MKIVSTYCTLALFMLVGVAEATPSHWTHDKLRLETKLEQDSTVFTITISRQKSLRSGKIFTAVIHVSLRPGWHIFSAESSSDCECGPVELAIPPEIASDFELVKFRESGNIRSWFDTNFQDTIKAHYTPFDVIAKIRVLRKLHGYLPFGLRLRYMAADSQYCMPPRWFEVPMTVLGKKPLKLHIAGAVEQNSGSYPYETYTRLA